MGAVSLSFGALFRCVCLCVCIIFCDELTEATTTTRTAITSVLLKLNGVLVCVYQIARITFTLFQLFFLLFTYLIICISLVFSSFRYQPLAF